MMRMQAVFGNMESRRHLCYSVVFLFLTPWFTNMSCTVLGITDVGLHGVRHAQALPETNNRLSNFNKPAVKSVQSPDGDVIDCIPKMQQPAFDHPKLRNARIQESPSLHPVKSSRAEEKDSSNPQNFQLWHQNGQCPSDTIPIRRIKESETFRINNSLSTYGRKFSGGVKPHSPPVPSPPTLNRHEHAISYLEEGPYFGAKATINLWRPAVQMPNEFSLSQIWVLAGSFEDDLNSAEAGWQVSPEIYGDTNPRFFTYWTSDAYRSTGCYNLLCSGFIQTSNEIVIGGSISPISTSNGLQYDITILIWKDPNTGHWWLEYGNKIVGYWPSSLFTHLAFHATTLEFGGEIVNSEPGGRHTTTKMGSGVFAEYGYGLASYFKNVGHVDSSNALRSTGNLQTFATYPECYNIMDSFSSDWGAYFYYGGPGLNLLCQ